MSGIDHGRTSDWSKTSERYAKYRDIYPAEFYERLRQEGVGLKGQTLLDLGTGTGVLALNMARNGVKYTGVDASKGQIEQARKLAIEQGMEIPFFVMPAEDLEFSDNSFDGATACQCYNYFNKKKMLPKLQKIIRPGGVLAVLYMMWLPMEDPVAAASEKLVLRHNPAWTGKGWRRGRSMEENYDNAYFKIEKEVRYELAVPFTRESWNGRMTACRGIGATLTAEETAQFEREHLNLLQEITPPAFTVLHEVEMLIFRSNK